MVSVMIIYSNNVILINFNFKYKSSIETLSEMKITFINNMLEPGVE